MGKTQRAPKSIRVVYVPYRTARKKEVENKFDVGKQNKKPVVILFANIGAVQDAG